MRNDRKPLDDYNPRRLEIVDNLRRNEQLYTHLVSNVKDYAIFMLDPQGRVMTWNEGASRIKGYSAKEIIGQPFSVFYEQKAVDDRHPWHELEIAKRDGRYEEEGWRVRKDGSLFWANVVITAVYDHNGELIGFGKVTRDLTERKEAERQAEEATERLRNTNEELQQLAYTISHELQPPVSTINRYGHLLSARYKERLGPDADEFIEKMIDASKLIERMVDDLWTYARTHKPGRAPELLDFNNPIDTALHELKDELGDAQISRDFMPSLFANRQQIIFLFKELIQNALRYRSSAVPQIHIGAKERDDGWLFSFKDNGVGIDKAAAGDIFKVYRRLDGSPDANATGMGLAICRKIVQNHGGDIWFDSQPGIGTTIYFHLIDTRKK